MTAILEVCDLFVYFEGIPALRGVNLSVERGQIVSILGANGAGKTTTLSAISGLVRDYKGKVTFRGRELEARLPAHERVKLGICHVREGRKIFPRLSTDENLRIGAYADPDAQAVKERKRKMYDLFPVLAERRDQMGGTLSGGEQQMLAIARGLMGNPELLLLDEPSLGLAPILIPPIFRALKRINSEGTTLLIVEQNARLALQVADYSYVLQTGKVSLSGTKDDLLAEERMLDAYLGGAVQEIGVHGPQAIPSA